MDAALAGPADYAAAEKLQVPLAQASSNLAVAEATARALVQAERDLAAQQAQQAREAQIAKAREQAGQEIAAALAAEHAAREAVDAALADMRARLGAAKAAWLRALAAESDINRARLRARDAQAARGDWPAGQPGPTPARANHASVLADPGRDPLVRELARWAP